MSLKTCPYLTLTTIVATGHYNTNFSMFWRSSLPIRGIRSCGTEALSNLAPHLLPVRKECCPCAKKRCRLNNCTCLPFGAGFGAMPGVATSAMAENHTNTDSIGLQLQVACWYEQEELPEA